MIVDDLRSRDLDDDVERSARVRWRGGAFRLKVQVPATYAAPPDDASAFVVAALPSAMRRAEPLHVDGTVSARLLGALRHVQSAHIMWDPDLTPCDVRVASTTSKRTEGSVVAAFFSRGVDSTFTAIGGGTLPADAFSQLVFSPSLHGTFSADVRRMELERTREAAAALGLGLLAVETNVREFTDLAVAFDDVQGAALAFMGLALAGGLRTIVVPSSNCYTSLKPWGSHPLLEPYFSTESVEIVHDAISQHRFGKVAYIAAQRPDMLAYLKVCWAEDRPDNCGRCAKCLETMAFLEGVGALHAATSMPATLDLDALRAMRTGLPQRMEIVEACRALDAAEHGPLRAALLESVRATVRPSVRARMHAATQALLGRRERADPRWIDDSSATRRNPINRLLAMLVDGRPYPPLKRRVDPLTSGGSVSVGPIELPVQPGMNGELVGLVRVLDRPAGRHVYGAGAVPAPVAQPVANSVDRRELVGELGGLTTHEYPGAIAVWVTSDGYVVTSDDDACRPKRPSAARAARWTLAPATWGRGMGPRTRAVAVLRRLVMVAALLRPRGTPGGDEPLGVPAGYLDPCAGADRVALYSAWHSVTGDQLVTTNPREATDLGYEAPVRLGYLIAEASVTGHLGTIRPHIEWATRFGQAVRAP